MTKEQQLIQAQKEMIDILCKSLVLGNMSDTKQYHLLFQKIKLLESQISQQQSETHYLDEREERDNRE